MHVNKKDLRSELSNYFWPPKRDVVPTRMYDCGIKR